MAKKKKDIIKERYHGPLITDGVSLGYIKLYPWVSLPFCIFSYFVAGHSDPIGTFKVIFLSCIIINSVSALFSFFNFLIERFKPLTYILIALVVSTILIWLDFFGLMMFLSDGSSFSAETFYNSPLTLAYVIPLSVLFIGVLLFYANYYRPKNQGKQWKFNNSGKDRKWSENFWITFGAVVLIPPFITSYATNIFGVLAGVLFTVTLAAVIVDALYAAIYVKKHPEAEHLE